VGWKKKANVFEETSKDEGRHAMMSEGILKRYFRED